MEIMEGNGGSLIVSELSHIQELVRQLEVHLAKPSSQVELCKNLASEIISLTDKSIGMIKSCSLGRKRPAAAAGAQSGGIESPRSLAASPLSEASDNPSRMPKKRCRIRPPFCNSSSLQSNCPVTTTSESNFEICEFCRKAMPQWRNQVRMSSVGGMEGAMDDGHNWRKYGQKDILGAKYPRGYYRCTHRNSQGCEATKQVQRTDEDPTVFDVVYHGNHTCQHRNILIPGPVNKRQEANNSEAQALLQSLSSSLTVKTEDLILEAQDWNPTPFSFSSAPENNIFSSPRTPENCVVCGVTPSPVTSESNHFSVSPCQVSGYGEGPRDWRSDSELAEVVSMLTTVTSAPVTVDMDSIFESFEYDPDFNLDASSFFS